MTPNPSLHHDVYECWGCGFAWIGQRGMQPACSECEHDYSEMIEMCDVSQTWRDKDGKPRRIRKRADVVDWNFKAEVHRERGTYWDPDTFEKVTFAKWLHLRIRELSRMAKQQRQQGGKGKRKRRR